MYYVCASTLFNKALVRYAGTPELGGGGAGGAAAPVALYQEGQGGQRCPFNLKDCLGEIANCQKC
jgi:hypothetical protein